VGGGAGGNVRVCLFAAIGFYVYVNLTMSVRSIALALGVSPTAVSLALKDSPRVSAALRAQVRRAARAAGHVPNARLAELMREVRHSAQPAYRATLGLISLFPEAVPWAARPAWGHLGAFASGARACAESHGYKLEDFWLKDPRMTVARLRAILEARGIKGLVCLGSLDPEEEFPEALRQFAVVTQGVSIPGRLHRVVSHFAADARVLYDELLRRGYRRPGLAILVSGDRRTDHLYSATFLGHQARVFTPPAVPVLRQESWSETEFDNWFSAHRPDVIVLHQHAPFLAAMEEYLARKRLRVPNDVGLALLDLNPAPARYAGIRQDPARMGAVAVEMLLGRLLLHDRSTAEFPRVELVVGSWNEGRTLRRPRAQAMPAGTRPMPRRAGAAQPRG
jgi:DNA-binding LacI/PurR family transcriptional regulator